MENVSRRGFIGASAVAGLGLAASGLVSSAAVAEEAPAESSIKSNAWDLTPIDVNKLMPAELGREWHEFKDSCGPLYPGYDHYEEYLDFIEQKLTEYGFVDKLQEEWQMQSYTVHDWPVHEGRMGMILDGEDIEAGAAPILCGDEDHQEATGELMILDINTDPETVEEGAYAGKILVFEPNDWPEKPYTDSFKGTYVITDTNYRSAPEPSVEIGEICPPTENVSWKCRWEFGQWSKPCALVRKGGAAGAIICTGLTWGTLKGLVDRQGSRRTQQPVVCFDISQKEKIFAAAEAGKEVSIYLKAEYLKTTNRNFFMFLPGKNYGTDADEYITINSHSDAMSLTQDNGALGTLGIAHYFSQIPQEQRTRTIVACIDTRHFIEGAENGTCLDWDGNEIKNFDHDPYVEFPEVAAKTVVTIGLEHMGEMEGAEDYEANDIVVTGRPEFSFMKADDNDWCARILIQAAIDSGLERADIKVDGRPGNFGEYKGMVRAVQASTHRLPVCVIGEAGNWPGAHTQEYTGIKFFGDKKFRDEVATWTQVTSNFMDVDVRVFDPCWSNLNKAVRSLGSKGLISDIQMNGVIQNIADIFGCACIGKFDQAAARLEAETKVNLMKMAPEGTDFSVEGALGQASGLSSGATLTEGLEFQGVVALVDAVIAKMA